jgi:hypothetical protein
MTVITVACFLLVSCLAYSLTLKMQVACSSETWWISLELNNVTI